MLTQRSARKVFKISSMTEIVPTKKPLAEKIVQKSEKHLTTPNRVGIIKGAADVAQW